MIEQILMGASCSYPDLLRKLLRYEPETGHLFWMERGEDTMPIRKFRLAWNKRFANKRAFTSVMKSGYYRGAIFGRWQYAHRVAYMIYHGVEIDGVIDHINGKRSDNRVANLRQASPRENGKNVVMSKFNKSGFNGVIWHNRAKKWLAFVKIGQKSKHIGYYSELADAIEARKQVNVIYGFSDRHGTKSNEGAENHAS